MTGGSKRWLPAALVVLAVAAIGVAARQDGPIGPGPADGVWSGARPVMAFAALIALIVIAVNFAKRRDDGYGVLRRAGTATAVLLIAAAVLTPIGLAALGHDSSPRTGSKPEYPDDSGSITRTLPMGTPSRVFPQHTGRSPASVIVLGLLIVIAGAVIALIVYQLIRLLSRRRFRLDAALTVEFDPLAAELEDLTEAVEAGTEALDYEGDAREAVIACYAAMEEAVSAGGGGRRATDTPEEFLRRATVADLIPEDPARRLTELFREARFSRHPISEDKRDEARQALRAIADHVRARAAQLAAAAAARAANAQAGAGAAAPTSIAGRAR